MNKEKSCGGVVFFKTSSNEILFLIEKMQLGHYSIPKGHVENNETNLETALREIKEETGLDVIYHEGFEIVKTYSPKIGTLKDVYFYCFETKSLSVIPQEIEVNSIYFLNYDEAYKILTYDTDKDVLEKAYNFIKQIIK